MEVWGKYSEDSIKINEKYIPNLIFYLREKLISLGFSSDNLDIKLDTRTNKIQINL